MGSRRPRVLFLTCHLPYPPISGGRRREFELLVRLSEHFDIHVYAASKTYTEDREHAAVLEEFCSDVQVSAKPDLRHSPDAYNGERSLLVAENASPKLARAAARMLQAREVDLIHAEGFYMAQHARDRKLIPLLLVEQNLEYTLCRQRAELSPVADKPRAVVEYLRTLRDETHAWRMADKIGAVTNDEADAMMEAAPDLDVRVLPDGFDHLAPRGTTPLPDATVPTVVFVANFAYQPNVDAAQYLCRRVMPLVRARRPDVRLMLVGNAPPPTVWDLGCDDVIVTGRVPDVSPYISQAHVVVSPLRIGGGIKVKVLEALHLGKAVVTTSVGIQGLPSNILDAVVLADDAGGFADAIVRVLHDAGLRRHLETTAATFARSLPTWDDAAAAVTDTYLDLTSVRLIPEAADATAMHTARRTTE